MSPFRRNLGQHLVLAYSPRGSNAHAFGGLMDRWQLRRMAWRGQPTSWSVLVTFWPGRRLAVEWWGRSLRERIAFDAEMRALREARGK